MGYNTGATDLGQTGAVPEIATHDAHGNGQ